jgi:hypothetical protein
MRSLSGAVGADEHVVDGGALGQPGQPRVEVRDRQARQVGERQPRIRERLQLPPNRILVCPVGDRGTRDDEDLLYVRLQLANEPDRRREVALLDHAGRIWAASRRRPVREENDWCLGKQSVTVLVHEINRRILHRDHQAESHALVLPAQEVTERDPVVRFRRAREIEELGVIIQVSRPA